MKLTKKEKQLLQELLRREFDKPETYSGQNYSTNFQIMVLSQKLELDREFCAQLIKDIEYPNK